MGETATRLTREQRRLAHLVPEVERRVLRSRRLRVDTGGRVRVESRRGELTGYAQVTEAVRPGAVLFERMIRDLARKVARERIYVTEPWEAPAWRAPSRRCSPLGSCRAWRRRS